MIEIDLSTGSEDEKPSTKLDPDAETVDCDAAPSPPPPARPKKGRSLQSVFETIDYFIVQNGYQCAACPQDRRIRLFRDLPELRRHMVQHVNGGRTSGGASKSGSIQCDHCDETFSRVDLLRAHLLEALDKEYGPSTHGNESDADDDGAVLREDDSSDQEDDDAPVNYIVKAGILTCSACDAEFGPVSRWNKEKFKMHVGKEHWKVPAFKCDECGRRFSDEAKLRRHMKQHTDVGWMGMEPSGDLAVAGGSNDYNPEEEDVLDIKLFGEDLKDPVHVQLDELPHPEVFIKTEPGEESVAPVKAKREASESSASSSASSDSDNSGSETDPETQVFTNKKLKVKAERKARHRRLIKSQSRKISGPDDGSIILACNLCDEGFLVQKLLDRHMTQKHDDRDRPFKCDLCAKTYITNGNLQEHVRMVHSGVKFPCKVCSIELSTKSSWKRHMKSHSENGFNCEICNEKCSSHSVLAKHKRRVHEKTGNSFICVDCGNTYDSNAALREHRVTHTDERPWACNVCGLKFKRNHNLQNHVKTHTMDKPVVSFPCQECDEVFPTKGAFAKHWPLHGKVTCALCRQTFDSQVDLMRHRREDHQITKREPGVTCRTCNEMCPDQQQLMKHRAEAHPMEESFECDVCKDVFSSAVGLRVHKREHKRGVRLYNCPNCDESFNCQPLLDTHLASAHSDVKNHVCEQCGQGYPSRKQLISHMSRHRFPQKKKKSGNSAGQFMCDICGKEFNFRITLKRHVFNIHTNKRSFKCETCGKVCQSSEGMRLHIRGHSDEQLIMCELCGKGFSQPYRLKEHMIRHEREKVVERCHLCNRQFRDIKKLELHLKSHSGETEFSCVPCQRHFATGRHYRLHMKRMHESAKPCPVCDKLFPTENKMKNHMRIHDNPNLFECPTCYACIKEKKHFDHHVRLHQQGKAERLPCRFCPLTFTLPKSRRFHETKFHKEQLNEIVLQGQDERPKAKRVKAEARDDTGAELLGGLSYDYPYGAPREDEVSVD